MRIGLVCPYNILKNGGVQDGIKNLQTRLSALGHQAYIITPKIMGANGKPPANTIFVGVGAPVKALNTTGNISVSVDTDQLEKILKEHKFDILHFHEPWVPILARQILARSNAVNVATFHAKLPDGLVSLGLERIITPYTKSVLRNLDALTAVSDAAAQYVRTLTTRKVKIIPNGIELSKYQIPKTKNQKIISKKTILYIGRLEKRKGVKYLIRAFSEVQKQQPDIILKIVGNGPERRKLENQASELKLKNVQFLGFVTEKTKIRLLKSADLFCSPATGGESFGIVLIEAMAAGCVTVAGDNAGYQTVLSGDGQMSLVNTKDTTEFARRLEILLFNDKLRKNWGKWAVKEIKRYDYQKVAAQYESIYKKALDS